MAGVYGGNKYPSPTKAAPNDAWFQVGFTAQSLVYSATYTGTAAATQQDTTKAPSDTLKGKTAEAKDK